ncbi:MAG: hypothetical protein WC379_17055, partial [Methanoregula sp.]
NKSVTVVENPFHPVIQPDGTKLYTTSFGNSSAGVRIDIVGPTVYLDDVEVLIDQDPQYLINPTLKSNIIDIRMNESFTYANITLDYDPVKEPNPSNLLLGYYNRTTGNYTFVPTTIDTTNHQVTAQVTHFSDWGAINGVSFYLLPAYAQTKTGYLKVEKDTVWSINPDVQSFSTTHFANAALLPPGNYTILASGSYSNTYTDLGIYQGCFAGWSTADSNPDTWSGMQLNFNNPDGASEVTVSSKRVLSGVLLINHNGGQIGVRNKHYTNPVCGSGMNYKMNYTGDKALYPPGMVFVLKLSNDFVTLYKDYNPNYKRGLGCIFGQAGKKGNYLEKNYGSLPNGGLFLGEDITNSIEYGVGQGACYYGVGTLVATPRDVLASLESGDTVGAIIYGGTGGISAGAQFTSWLKNPAIPKWLAGLAGKYDVGKQIVKVLKQEKIIDYLPDDEVSILVRESLGTKENEVYNILLAEGKSPDEIVDIIISPRGLVGTYVDREAVSYNQLSGNAHWYDPQISRNVIGRTGIYDLYAKLKGYNYLKFSSGWSKPINEKYIDIGIKNGDEFICTANPFEPEAGSIFETEVNQLKEAKYKVVGDSWTETVAGEEITLWRMVQSS